MMLEFCPGGALDDIILGINHKFFEAIVDRVKTQLTLKNEIDRNRPFFIGS